MRLKQVSKRVKAARTAFGLTQSELAYRMGISTQLVSAFESGRIVPKRQYLAKIAQFTHKPISYFTGEKWEEVRERLTLVQKELAAITALLDDDLETSKSEASSEAELRE